MENTLLIDWPQQQMHNSFQPMCSLESLHSPNSIMSSSPSIYSTSSNGSSPCSGIYDCGSVEGTQGSICKICGGQAFNRHFSAVCCNACAAFFRRTINGKKAYVCLNGKNCEINKKNERHLCKFCRFVRCIRFGLNISIAISRVPPEKNAVFASKSPLKQLVGHQQETFLHRFIAAIEVQNGRSDRVMMGQKNPTFVETMNSIRGEYYVLNEYLKTSGFGNLGLNSEQIQDLSRSIFYSWLVFSSVTSTARNSGFKKNEIYLIDESHMEVEIGQVSQYHSSCPNLIDPNQCTRIAMVFYGDVLTAAQKLHSARLDESEVASTFQILALKEAQRLFSDKNESIKQEMSQLFECLRDHYESNFDEISIRMGNLILLTDEIESLTRAFNEYIVILQLNGYKTVLSTFENAPNTWTYT